MAATTNINESETMTSNQPTYDEHTHLVISKRGSRRQVVMVQWEYEIAVECYGIDYVTIERVATAADMAGAR